MDISIIFSENIWPIILGITLIFTLSVLYIYYKMDEFDPEPISHILVAFIFGILTPIFTLPLFYGFAELLSLIYSDEVITVISIILFAPIVEEIAKGYLLLKVIDKFHIDGPMDGLVYGVAIGAGFATIENIVYGISTYYILGFSSAIQVTVLRGSFVFIGHPIYTGIFGWGVGAQKIGLAHNRISEIYSAILLHMLWNGVFVVGRLRFITNFFLGIYILSVVLLTYSRFYSRMKTARNIEFKLNEQGYYQNKKKSGYRIGSR